MLHVVSEYWTSQWGPPAALSLFIKAADEDAAKLWIKSRDDLNWLQSHASKAYNVVPALSVLFPHIWRPRSGLAVKKSFQLFSFISDGAKHEWWISLSMKSEHPKRAADVWHSISQRMLCGTICWFLSLGVVHDEALWCQITVNRLYENQPGCGIQASAPSEKETCWIFPKLSRSTEPILKNFLMIRQQM